MNWFGKIELLCRVHITVLPNYVSLKARDVHANPKVALLLPCLDRTDHNWQAGVADPALSALTRSRIIFTTRHLITSSLEINVVGVAILSYCTSAIEKLQMASFFDLKARKKVAETTVDPKKAAEQAANKALQPWVEK